MADMARSAQKSLFHAGIIGAALLMVQPEAAAQAPSGQFQFKPDTPLKDLLPIPPQAKKNSTPWLSDDLGKVPEVSLQDFQPKLLKDKARWQTASTIAKINDRNRKHDDGFMELLLATRSDLKGLPFTLGEACRKTEEQSWLFREELALIRGEIREVGRKANFISGDFYPIGSGQFWRQYGSRDNSIALMAGIPSLEEKVTGARVAALMQVFGIQDGNMNKELVKYLAGISHREGSRALTRIALFSTSADVRQAAVEALKKRHKDDYTSMVLEGMRYPWPAVAQRAAQTMSKLKRIDLVPQLVALLDEPDPRLPILKEVNNQKVPVVRELVRVNHHRNCLLCHAPATGKLSAKVVTAPVPIPGEPFDSFGGYYNRTKDPDILFGVAKGGRYWGFLAKMAAFRFPGPQPQFDRGRGGRFPGQTEGEGPVALSKCRPGGLARNYRARCRANGTGLAKTPWVVQVTSESMLCREKWHSGFQLSKTGFLVVSPLLIIVVRN